MFVPAEPAVFAFVTLAFGAGALIAIVVAIIRSRARTRIANEAPESEVDRG